MKTKYNNGFSFISVLFILAVTSLFVTVINEQRSATSLDISVSLLDANIANQIAVLGTHLGLNELATNINYTSDYTSDVPVLDEMDTSTIFGISSGTITLKFVGTSGNISDQQLLIISTGTFGNATRTITLTINKVTNKRMLMIEPIFSTDSQFNTRRDSFENLGWEITTVPENSITFGGASLDPILQISWNLIYIPQNITIDKNEFNEVNSPIVAESIDNTQNFGILASSTTFDDVFTTTLEAQATSQNYSMGTVISFSTINTYFKNLKNVNLVSDAIKEFSDSNISQTQQNDEPIIVWLPEGGIIADSTPSPNARIVLNNIPNDTYPWSMYTASGLSAFNTILSNISCQYTNCFIYEIRHIEYL